MKKKGIDYIWFDLGYTLLYLKREDLFFKVMAPKVESLPSRETVTLAFHLADKLFMREYPGVLGSDKDTYIPWYFGFIFHYLKMKVNLCKFSEEWKKATGSPLDAWHLCPGAKEALSLLKGRGLSLGVISNWDSSARPILSKLGILNFFSTIVISSEEGIAKPSREIFERALEKSGAKADTSLYVGDNYYDDAVGSSKVGMDVVIINRYGSVGIEELSGITIIENIRELPDLINHLL